MSTNVEQILRDIEEADMILVGLGEEFEEKFIDKKNYEGYFHLIKGTKYELNLSEFIKSAFVKQNSNNNIQKAYSNLAKLISDKNYFIVTTCKDNYIMNIGLDSERIVQPCGTYEELQCENNCENILYKAEEYTKGIMQELEVCIQNHNIEKVNSIEIPQCPNCGEKLVFNNMTSKKYSEIGYLPKWKIYTNWLQGTLNRRVCILELGVGVQFPTVIRWPFEKIAFFNQKSSFYRVHQSLYQLSEVLVNKGISIPENALQYLTNNLFS